MKPLIDSDILLYEVGFSSEKNEVVDGVKVVTPASWDFCQDILDRKIKLICDEVGATEPPLLFLTNTHYMSKTLNKQRVREDRPVTAYKENFRVKVAKEKDYKAGRSATKPFHFRNIIHYLINNYDVHVNENGLEADDALCIEQIRVAKEYGVRVPFHAGYFLLDYEDWVKWGTTTFIRDNKGYVINDTGKGDTRKVWNLHRELMGNPEGLVVDHINGDTLDNRRYNLRVCTVKENVRNSASQAGTSVYKGVCWDVSKNKWLATIKVDRVPKFLGRFTEELEAAKAYDDAAKQYFGVFARLNLTTTYVKPVKETIICSRDKDVRMCPLRHYSWESGKQASIGPILVDELGTLIHKNPGERDARDRAVPAKIFGTGGKFFYYQLLTGDTVDNIGGVKGRGPVFAYTLLWDCTSLRECYERVAECYVKNWGDDWKIKMKEQVNLLWMVRELDERGEKVLWTPPKNEVV